MLPEQGGKIESGEEPNVMQTGKETKRRNSN